MKADLVNHENKKVGTVELSDRVFGVKWNPALVRQMVVAQFANARKPIAHTKDRSEVRGGGKKPWKQKHTGRARHGSSRSPLWSGGGITFGPRNTRDYTQKVNKKMRRGALVSVLSKKLADKEIYFIDDLKLADHKTKGMVAILKNFFKTNESVLLIPARGNKNIFMAGKNIKKVGVADPETLNLYDCLAYHYIIVEKAALEALEK
ncbi:MAG: 50S ribosomal protein L4 [Patescibacteria group bacterium]